MYYDLNLFETLLNLINYELLDDMNIFPIPLNILDILVHKVVDFFVCGCCLNFYL